MVVDLKCGIDGSTKASCTQIYTGPASLYTTADGVDPSKTTTWTASQSLESGKVTYMPITITASATTSGTVLNSASSAMSKGQAVAAPTAGLGQVFAAGLVAAMII